MRAMPIGTAVHERTFALCESLNYREWSGYYAVSAYEAHHEHEYNAIRNAVGADRRLAALQVPDQRAATPRSWSIASSRATPSKIAVGQVYYTPWCDEHGKVIDDGTVTRLSRGHVPLDRGRSEPALVHAERRSASTSRSRTSPSRSPRSRCRGRPPARLLDAVADADIDGLKYFRMTRGTIAGVPVDISRTGYTGDLGYEIWMPWDRAVDVWDALMTGGRPFDIHPAGMLALDVARIEAGLLLIDVDFYSSKKALIESQKYSPFEMGLGRLVQLDKRAVRRPRRAARGAAPRAGAADRRPRDRAGRRSRRSTTPSVSRRRSPRPRRASPCPCTGTAARSAGDDDDLVAGAEEADRAGHASTRRTSPTARRSNSR